MSEVEWEGMRPPTGPAPEPPVGEQQSWPPITSPVAIVPPPPPPMPPPPAPGAPTRGGGRRIGAVAVGALVLLVAGFVFARVTEDGHPAVGRAAPAFANGSAATVDPKSSEPIAAVAAAVSPAVVQIEGSDDLGSGFIYDTEGHILTAAHVVAGQGTTVDVRLADGSVHKGDVLGADTASDVAVIKIDPVQNMQVATLAVGVKVLVGQTAVAIGSPFGLDQTVTAGIVSAVDRPTRTPGGAIDMYQIDAPINPGNSGGPVADKLGRVFGMSDSIAGANVNVGLGFLVPIDLAKDVADKIVAGQPVEFAFLGVSTRAESTSSAVIGDGAIVVSVSAGSPADQAGVKEGDRVTSVDSAPVRDEDELTARVRSHQPGDHVQITFVRDGQTQTVQVVLGSTKTK
jgi:putative serine protease PepD